MTVLPKEVSDKPDLDIVELRHPDGINEWFLCLPDATDEELNTVWILAEKDEYTSLEDAR